MLLKSFIPAIAGLSFFANGAALLSPRQASGSGITTVFQPTTVTAFQTVSIIVTAEPTAVTVVEPDTAAIASTLAWVSSVEAQHLSDQAQEAPISGKQPTSLHTFVRTIDVPAFEVDRLPGTNTAVYYISKNASHTTIPLSIVTITVSPVPRPGDIDKNVTSTLFLSREVTVTQTLHSSFSSPAGGWNNTNPSSTMVDGVGATGTGFGTGTGTGTGTGVGKTYSTSLTVAPIGLNSTMSMNTTTVRPTVFPTGGYGYKPHSSNQTYAYGYGYQSPNARQICTLISAVMFGQTVSWCNNWGGPHSTLTFTSWSKTVIPTYIPGIGPIPPPSTSNVVEVTPTTLLTSFAVRSITVTADASTLTSSSTNIAGTTTSSPTDIEDPNALTTTSSDATTTSSTTSTIDLNGFSTTTTTGLSTSSTPSACGETGAFDITFDNLPVFSAPATTTDKPVIFNPYQHFSWSRGFSYGPPPEEPYLPNTGDRLAEYNPHQNTVNTGSPNAGLLGPGAFGAGPRSNNDHYWFNILSMYVGCNTTDTAPDTTCEFYAEGYKWDEASQRNKLFVTQNFPQESCVDMHNCELQQIFFNEKFTGLAELSFYANVRGQLRSFWLDTLEMSWFNNTCEAGLERISSRK